MHINLCLLWLSPLQHSNWKQTFNLQEYHCKFALANNILLRHICSYSWAWGLIVFNWTPEGGTSIFPSWIWSSEPELSSHNPESLCPSLDRHTCVLVYVHICVDILPHLCIPTQVPEDRHIKQVQKGKWKEENQDNNIEKNTTPSIKGILNKITFSPDWMGTQKNWVLDLS